jgi:hypothetical protein
MHQLIFLKAENLELQKANKKLSRRRLTKKKKRLQDGGSLTIQDGEDLQAQIVVDEQLQGESHQSSGRTRRPKTCRRRCRTCGETGHNLQTCQNRVETSEEEYSE